ncbi:putative GTPase activating protein [Dioszegia hungarica]|uniref:GTPase activating protein n=1 Tax=Dioszegia hungarica TaxID=4972 RepID=A0AA38H9P4_9TREE|nr:putative GTPase activating protein [Dioszegia hungarica]KAI9636893.1 putative GTPase activating protein [Dioszegia hungarica]
MSGSAEQYDPAQSPVDGRRRDGSGQYEEREQYGSRNYGQDQPPSAQAYSQHPSGLTQNQSYPMSSSSQSGSSYASSTSYPSTQQGQPLPQNQSRPSLSDRQQSFSDSAQSHQVVSPVGNGSGGPSISAPRPGLAEHRQSSGNTSISVAGQWQGQNMMGAASATSLGSMTVGGSSQMGGMGGMGVGMGGKEGEAVPVGFDEGVLRGLCEMDCALPLLADRIKQSISSCKQVATFFRSRADIEEKYARSLVELGRTTGDLYARGDCKAGTFVNAYHTSLRLQETLAQNRIRFSQRLNEMSDELIALSREGERMRKQHKENGARYQGILQESEMVMDKAKSRFDQTAEELERLLVAKEGESFKESGMRSSGSVASNSSGGMGNGGQGMSGQGGHNGGGKKVFNKAITKGGMLFKGKGPASIAKQEDEVRGRMAQASETFRKAVLESQGLRQEYFNFQLPKILRLLKECADELDLGTQYHLTRFAFLYESTLVGDGTILSPLGATDETLGLKQIFESIDNRTDFKSYMQNYAVARGTPRGPRRDGPYEEGFLPPMPTHIQKSLDPPQPSHSAPGSHNSPSGNAGGLPNGSAQKPPSISSEQYSVPGIPASTGATFGVDLGEQLQRDGVEVPRVVELCAKAIEAYGIDSMGIYRLSGTSSRVQALKRALDTDLDNTDVMSDEWSADINVVSGALKLWFRELPEPLLTYGLYHQFIEAARYENDRLRHIRLHEQVNELPDPNYATLKFFMAHLDRIRNRESSNQMTVSNLSIVFGPTLLGAPPEEGGLNLEHMSFQCKAIETILEKYHEIFVEDEDNAAGAAP